jgi:hypothetical protein
MYKDGAPNPFDLFSAALHLGSDGQRAPARPGWPKATTGSTHRIWQYLDEHEQSEGSGSDSHQPQAEG